MAKPMVQDGVLPFAIDGGAARVMLVTSRPRHRGLARRWLGGRRWIVPKGRPERGLPPHEVAAREAYEEAGLLGTVERKPFFAFDSVRREARTLWQIYLFRVGEVLEEWPEKHERERRWVAPGEAALMVSEPGLAQMMVQFSGLAL
jgi:8-oxo-dGTP pyrophosphatase MutT (NUDIX family)